MAGKRKLEIEILDSHKGSGFKDSEKAADSWGKKLGGFAKTAAIGLGVVGVGAVAMGVNFAKAAEESRQVTNQTAAVIKSMGNVAHISANQVADLSEKLSLKSGIDDELIQSGQNVLLTFGNVRNEVGKGNDIFNRATVAALDMSVALKQDLSSANIQLGKALNDPIKGITALSRAGVSFTQEQKDQIKSLVEHGKTLEAQKIILGELEHQFAGSAEAQATASGKLAVAWGNIQETLGEALLPVFDAVSGWLATTLPKAVAKVTPVFRAISGGIKAFVGAFRNAEDGVTSSGFAGFMEKAGIKIRHAFDAVAKFFRQTLVPAFQDAAQFVTGKLVPAMEKIGDWAMKHKPLLIGVAVAIAVPLVSAFLAWAGAAALAAASTIAATLPIIAVGAAIAGLVAGLIWAYQHWGFFRTAVDGVAHFMRDVLWPIIKGIAGWITGTLIPTIGKIALALWHWRDTAKSVAEDVKNIFGGIIDWFKKLPGRIAAIANGMWDAIYRNLAGVIGKVEGGVRRILELMHLLSPSNTVNLKGYGGGYASFGAGAPGSGSSGGGGYRKMASGGIVRHRPGGIIANIGEGRHDEAVVPLDGRTLGGNTYIIQIDRPIVASEAEFRRMVKDAANDLLQLDPRAITVRGKQLATT